MSETPWTDEYYHDDNNFDLLSGEKRAKGRVRQARSCAAALAKNPERRLKAIASKLRSCAQNRRCGCGICSQCLTATKRGFMATTSSLFGSVDLAFLTILPTAPALKSGRLQALNIHEHHEALAESWRAAGLEPIPLIAGLDLSWNTHAGLIDDKFWCAHWHGFIPAEFKSEIERRLRFLYPRTISISKPIDAKLITETPERVYSYAFKTSFEARHQFIHSPTKRDPAEWDTITPKHPCFPTLALNLDRIGLRSRIIQLGGEASRFFWALSTSSFFWGRRLHQAKIVARAGRALFQMQVVQPHGLWRMRVFPIASPLRFSPTL